MKAADLHESVLEELIGEDGFLGGGYARMSDLLVYTI